MQPKDSRNFVTVAEQRFTAAEALLNFDFTLDAQYIGGYVVECSLKALILENTPATDRADKLKRITTGGTIHKHETLLQELRDIGISLTPEIAKRLRRFDWSVSLRYETGRRSRGETRRLLKTTVEY